VSPAPTASDSADGYGSYKTARNTRVSGVSSAQHRESVTRFRVALFRRPRGNGRELRLADAIDPAVIRVHPHRPSGLLDEDREPARRPSMQRRSRVGSCSGVLDACADRGQVRFRGRVVRAECSSYGRRGAVVNDDECHELDEWGSTHFGSYSRACVNQKQLIADSRVVTTASTAPFVPFVAFVLLMTLELYTSWRAPRR
jgi:hypothetical protein